MSNTPRYKAFVNDCGQLIISAEAAEALGLKPGVPLLVEAEGKELRIVQPISRLARIYIEPTNVCNFDCRTCMRNVWTEPLGFMSAEVFAKVLQGLSAFSPTPLVFFGGFGEPLAHPRILQMIQAVKELGAQVELITNGSLLTEKIEIALMDAGLDRLWVSLDGATPESYADVRLGDALPGVIENLTTLVKLRLQTGSDLPRLGIAFVAMKRNIDQLPKVIRLGTSLGADRFSVSNVLAHTPELRQEILYENCMYQPDQPISNSLPLIDLPRMDISPLTVGALAEILNHPPNLPDARRLVTERNGKCPFIEKCSTSIRWDGEVSPCLPLLHTHISYLDNHERLSQAFSTGNINIQSLVDLWKNPSYTALRERLQVFDFSPCVLCNSCNMSASNREDCFGNTLPTCGGCLWAQGLIQCP
jgi:MoaA/NifB/PqqE/SkfB family radical SAM enzyme